MNTAALFPGQGSQSVGMGLELSNNFEIAKNTFAEADDALGFSISKLCFEGPEDDLKRTEFTQPAILTTSIAALRVAQAEAGVTFDIAAGHSLGEWSALVAVGVLSLADAVRLVHLRGKAMQSAVPEGVGAMAAIIGLDLETLSALCTEAAQGEVCTPANLNGGGQIVVSGNAGAVDRLLALAEAKGAKRAIKLQVSAPFHCALMKPAADVMSDALAATQLHGFAVPVVANVDATEYSDINCVKPLLVEQITGTVRWDASIERIAALGVTAAYEFGAGSVLKGLVRGVTRAVKVTSVGAPADIASLVAAKTAS